MSVPAAGRRAPAGLRAAAGMVALGLFAAGCASARAQQGPEVRADTTAATAASGSAVGPDGPGPSDSPDPALAGHPTPTLPPGDPGIEDLPPDGDDPDGDPPRATGEHGDETPAGVAAGALLDAGTVASAAGGTWSATATPAGCTSAAPVGSAAARSLALAAAGGDLTQTVATYPDAQSAAAAVTGTGDRLAACGFTVTGDPRLGEASVELSRLETGERAMVLAADGALAMLVASGSPAAPGTWESLADLALGTSCAAAPHGCH